VLIYHAVHNRVVNPQYLQLFFINHSLSVVAF
jgi:hypothetical protein